MAEVIYENVQDYYTNDLKKSDDLQTNACCTMDAPPAYIREILKKIHPEVLDKYYGCGLTIPLAVEGLKILDLGSGSGRDCYIASALVGERGNVIGVDMTEAQLAVANRHIEFHQDAFGYKQSNVGFIQGNIDDLASLNIEDNSLDLIISNCVINLCRNKQALFNTAYKLLKTGGEMYFSDVYVDRRLDVKLMEDKALHGECLSGALYWNDFLRMAKSAGFIDPRVIASNPITIENKDIEAKLGSAKFYSVTYRLFKLPQLESDCEDYGQAVRYKGTIEHAESAFDMDEHHRFEAGKIMPVCGNSFDMLHDTRFREHFDFFGDKSVHYGIFEGCGTNMPFSESTSIDTASSCC